MKRFLLLAIVALAAAATGYVLGTRNVPDAEPMAKEDDAPAVLYWVAPMDPDYRRDQPGKSPMGMDLVPVYATDTSSSQDDDAIHVAPHIQQSLGVRTAPVTRGPFAQVLETVGYTHWDESTVSMLHPRASGWLQSLSVASVGDRVSKGQVLYELYSPALTSAQQEYLTATQSSSAGLRRAARERLVALGMTRAQINNLERERQVTEALAHRAPQDAVVTAMAVRKGNYVTPATHILTLADLTTIWIEVEVFESNIGWMSEGLQAQATFDAYPGQLWHGRVAYMYPALDPHTRTLRLRLEFDNADGRLRPQMLARVRIDGATMEDVVQIPREALIRAGGGTRVVLSDGDGRFEVVGVRVGRIANRMAQILDGLAPGQRVVTSGQFLLDAEANGEQALSRIANDGAQAKP